MNRNLKLEIGFVCAVGAFIGALIALHAGYFWPVGIIVGGLIGYLGIRRQEVVEALRQAYHQVSGCKLEPDWILVKDKAKGAGLYLLALLSIDSWFLAITIPIHLNFPNISGMFLLVTIIVINFLQLIYHVCALWDWKDGKDGPPFLWGRWQRVEVAKYNVLYVCFYRLPCWTILGICRIPRALVWSAKAVVSLGRKALKFCKAFFFLVHSQLRLLCAVDSALGALVGYFCGSPAIGAICGAALGIVNYELVSVRLLGLVPSAIRH